LLPTLVILFILYREQILSFWSALSDAVNL